MHLVSVNETMFRRNELALLFCLTNVPPPSPPGADLPLAFTAGLSDTCEDLVWRAKVRVSNDADLVARAGRVCAPNADLFAECLEDDDDGIGDSHPSTGRGRVLSWRVEPAARDGAHVFLAVLHEIAQQAVIAEHDRLQLPNLMFKEIAL